MPDQVRLDNGWFQSPAAAALKARLKGKVLPGGGDWILADAQGIWHMDVRLLLETDDGARILMLYHGILQMNDTLREALTGGGETQFGDDYLMIQPRFETGDERYL